LNHRNVFHIRYADVANTGGFTAGLDHQLTAVGKLINYTATQICAL